MQEGPDTPASADDPRPLPPREPALEDCCGGGCQPCVFDRYHEALERYRHALDSWLQRHPDAALNPGSDARPEESI